MTPTEKRLRLREILRGETCVAPATVWDALSARVAEMAGYETGILSGAVCAMTSLGAPDHALHTLTEFASQIRCITRASNLSVFADADQGYGNALNVVRTVQELEHAGLAGLSIEDLVAPARFGGQDAAPLIDVREAVGKLAAALSARSDPTLLIVARTAALRFDPVAKVVERLRAYAATGVDAVFLTRLKTLQDLDAIRAAIDLPIIVGRATELQRSDLEARGIRLRLHGHAVLPACVKAMYDTYRHFASDGSLADLAPNLASEAQMAEVTRVADFDKMRDTFLR